MALHMKFLLILASITLPKKIVSTDLDPFSDSIPFSIKWSGSLESQPQTQVENLVTMKMVTSDSEQYECRVPVTDQLADRPDLISSYSGPSVTDILRSFYERISCSYRKESFWSYELCHTKHLKQYHQENDPKSESGLVITQQYLLGKFNRDFVTPDDEEVPTIQVEENRYPYHMVEYTDGTLCDLTQAPRRTLIYYICHESGQGDMYEVKETATCEYSVVVVLSDLCNHPRYRTNKEPSRVISCYSLGSSPDRPKQQKEMDMQLQKQKTAATRRFSTETSTITGTGSPLKDLPSTSPTKELSKEELESTRTGISASEDHVFLQQFLSGEHCLNGDSGWWKYEFCYGKHAQQYHVEGGKREQTILLGLWNKQVHLDWLANNPNKRPKSLKFRKYISLFYASGNICDLTKAPRQVEVKLKCIATDSSSSHSIAIYLLEPHPCDYILTIESPMLCDIVKRANDDGLIPEY